MLDFFPFILRLIDFRLCLSHELSSGSGLSLNILKSCVELTKLGFGGCDLFLCFCQIIAKGVPYLRWLEDFTKNAFMGDAFTHLFLVLDLSPSHLISNIPDLVSKGLVAI